MTDHVGTLGRGGVVIAMSSGLVATMGLPASAAEHSTAQDAAPATAPIAVQPALALSTGLMAAPATLDATAAPLTAPAAATVSFENSAFKAVPKAPAHSASTSSSAKVSSGTHAAALAASLGAAKGSGVLAIAARYLGVPYVYGGTSPVSGWDCSGATQYIYRQIGVSLPRTAEAQMLASTRVSRSEAKPGDEVFFISGGSAYHVGIYAGNNMMYDAQHTGASFTYREIFSSAVVFGRV